MGDKKYPSDKQKEILVQFMAEHPELVTGLFTEGFSRQVSQRLWQHITEKLNVIKGGTKKDWIKWRKTWQDLKKNAIAKEARNRKCMSGTGGGPPKVEPLSLWETQILDLIPKSKTQGLSGIREANTSFHFENEIEEQAGILPEMIVDQDVLVEETKGLLPSTSRTEPLDNCQLLDSVDVLPSTSRGGPVSNNTPLMPLGSVPVLLDEMWSQEEITLLIELYQEHPCLYATKNRDYHNKYKRSLALENLCQSLSVLRPGITSQDVEKKFQGLRTTYSIKRKKVLESMHSGMGECEIYHPSLWYYDKLFYLNDHLQIRNSRSSLVLSEPDSVNTEVNTGASGLCLESPLDLQEESEIQFEEYNVDDCGILSPTTTTSHSQSRPSSQQSGSRDLPVANKKEKNKRRKLNSTADETEINILTEISTGLKTMSAAAHKTTHVERTPEDVVGEFVAMQLKLIKNESLKQDVQLGIVRLLGEAMKKQ